MLDQSGRCKNLVQLCGLRIFQHIYNGQMVVAGHEFFAETFEIIDRAARAG